MTESDKPTTVTCKMCGATGPSYFGGHTDPLKPHFPYLATGTEGMCELCGEPPEAEVHAEHLKPYPV